MNKTFFGSSDLLGLRTAITIGVFDGLHLGHLKIIEALVKLSLEKGLTSVVMTFSVNPKMALGKQRSLESLTTDRLFEQTLSNMGVDWLCTIDFSPQMSKLSGMAFIDRLCTLSKVDSVLVGKNFRCGAGSESAGPVQLRRFLAAHDDAQLVEIDYARSADGQIISSSLLREQMLAGRLDKANSLLGRPYCLDLASSPSSQDGSDLIYSTGSIHQLLVPQGSYDATVFLEDGRAIGSLLEMRSSYLRLKGIGSAKADKVEILQRRSNQNGN